MKINKINLKYNLKKSILLTTYSNLLHSPWGITLLSYYFADPSDNRYVGCYVENLEWKYALFWWVHSGLPQTTNANCIDACKANGFKYSGNVSILKYGYIYR